jgi:hypothetical protein
VFSGEWRLAPGRRCTRGPRGTWTTAPVRALFHPHVASDGRIHGFSGPLTSVVRGAPAGRVCPPVAIVLFAAHGLSNHLVTLGHRIAFAWGLLPTGFWPDWLAIYRPPSRRKIGPGNARYKLHRAFSKYPYAPLSM